ncbi:endonuclease/exonuclease/phosphatase family protein [Pedobacter heparinus]|uniref:endonuclease/exonuclease/phosphatase family protein n=1 Tax=Pedobacter heparinus TaxID=984 RepID=UPI00292CD2E6|nr:endonuclease/exonuclease/phosphatase family protein [Pedobacter heparinus]
MKTIQLFVVTLLLTATVNAQRKPAGYLNVMSYNIRYNNTNDGDNAWPNRKDAVKALIRFHDADILCVQEALALQVDQLLENTDFEMAGVGRTDGKREGEFSAIYFDKKRFVKKDGGTFWLSNTPEKPSKGWDAAIVRICTWLRLYDKWNKKEFMVFNTHYDHVGVQARIESAKLIKKKIQEIAPTLPVILTGDLNVTPETEAITTIKTFLTDTKEASIEPAYGPEGTFNGFKFNAPLKDRIDYIFINKGFKVQKFGVLSDSKQQRYPSDHLPIVARLFF